MVSKAMILGAAAALVATATGYYVATVGSGSDCNGGCPIRAMLGSNAEKPATETQDGGSCCSHASKAALLVKKPEIDASTLAACVGANAYATHAQPAACCAHE